MSQNTSMPLAAWKPLQITHMGINDLQPNLDNPRQHDNKQVRQIANSIKAFGFVVPITVDAQRRIVAGHGRYLAALQLGLAQVPTICVEHLTPSQLRAFAIADNKLTENAKWDQKLLGEQFQALALEGLDLGITGFEMPEIDLVIQSLTLVPEDQDAADSEILPVAEKALSSGGDLWLLGEHRLACGSALDSTVYQNLFADQRAALVFTDPPFNLRIDGCVGGNGAIKHREFAMAAGEMSTGEFTGFLSSALGLAVRYSTNGSIHYVCMDWRHMSELLAAGQQVGYTLKNLAVWAKDRAGMGSFYRSQHELIFIFKNGTAPHQNNFQLGQHGRHRSNVWSYPAIAGRKTEEGDLLALHPTVKPIKMVADAILDCSRRGEIVFDGFLGSGTTLLAAERVGRRCYGIELDPLYVDCAIRWWQNLTGQDAIHAETGATFNATEAAHV